MMLDEERDPTEADAACSAFVRMVEAEDLYRRAMVDQYGESALEAADDPERRTATPRLFDLRVEVTAARAGYYGTRSAVKL